MYWIINFKFMNSLIAVLLLVFLLGCISERSKDAPPFSTEQVRSDKNNLWQSCTIPELGIKVRVPPNPALINWSHDLFTLLLHPLIKHPVTDINYGISIEFTRIPAWQVPILFPAAGTNNLEDIHVWNMSLHKELAVKVQNEDKITYVRRDIVNANGEVLCMRGTVRASPRYNQDVNWTKKILGSVEPLNGSIPPI